MKLLSIIFSFRNEEENIPNLVSRVSSTVVKLNNWKYEMIFINDDSSDSSEKLLTELQKKYPIKIINMSRRFGNAPCILAGFDNCSGDCVVYMESDLQDPPELIPKLIEKFENGFDVVHTVRTKRLGESKLQIFLTKIAYRIINKLSYIPLPLDAGDFKLISKRAIEHIRNPQEYNPYVRGLSVWVGFKQAFVEYVLESRHAGKSKFPLFSSFGPTLEFIRGITSFSLAPLYLGIILGLITFLFSIILIFYALYQKFIGLAVPGVTQLLISISFFSGIILITIGISSLYIARIHEQTRRRPRYVIKEIKNYKKNE